MSKSTGNLFLVHEEILPEALKKTIKVKELLKKDSSLTINEAVAKMDLSRSAYYKYKDSIFPFYEASQDKILTFHMVIKHKQGVLSEVLNAISEDSGNVLTINQEIPLQGVARVTISIETNALRHGLEPLIEKLRTLEGVRRFKVVSHA